MAGRSNRFFKIATYCESEAARRKQCGFANKASGGYVLNNNNKTLCVLAMLPFAVIVVFLEVLPIAMTIFRSFISEGGGGLTIDNYTAIFTKAFTVMRLLTA